MVPKTFTSLQHPFVKYLVCLRKDRSFRKKEKKILLSGNKIVEELSQKNTPIHTLLVQEGTPVPSSISFQEVYLVSREILKKITGLPEPEPLAALISMPSFQDLSSLSYILVLDRLSDPGNLGTLLRSALALGWDGVYLLETTCDPFNEKALRAAKGATFRLPLAEGSWQDFTKMVQENSFHVAVADIEGDSLSKCHPSAPLALILSHETHGARKEAKEAFQRITIPMPGDMESLNVSSAGAILLYHLRGCFER